MSTTITAALRTEIIEDLNLSMGPQSSIRLLLDAGYRGRIRATLILQLALKLMGFGSSCMACCLVLCLDAASD